MVQVTVNEIVNVIAVRYLRMAAIRAMDVTRSVTVSQANAAVGIGRRHFEYALVDMIAMRVMQMAVMQVVDVAIVFDRQVTAARSMLMRMLHNFRTGGHNRYSLWKNEPVDSLPPVWQSGLLLAPTPLIAGSEAPLLRRRPRAADAPKPQAEGTEDDRREYAWPKRHQVTGNENFGPHGHAEQLGEAHHAEENAGHAQS